MTATPRLLTGRLALDPLRVEDAEDMAVVLADPALYTFIGGEPPSVERLRDRFGRMIAGPGPDDAGQVWHNWTVRLRAPGDEPAAGPAVGTVQATVTPAGATSDVAWVVGTGHQGLGLATEAATAMAGWLLSTGVRRLVAHIHPEHAASEKVAQRIGLLATGTFDDDGEQLWALDGPDEEA